MRLYELLESLDKDQQRVGQVAGEEKARKVGTVLGKAPKQHPFKGRLVGESDSDQSHGSPYDRGAADSWYRRPRRPDPEYTPQQQAEYNKGYEDNQKSPDMRKDYR